MNKFWCACYGGVGGDLVDEDQLDEDDFISLDDW
jgi:hypothetical protein